MTRHPEQATETAVAALHLELPFETTKCGKMYKVESGSYRYFKINFHIDGIFIIFPSIWVQIDI